MEVLTDQLQQADYLSHHVKRTFEGAGWTTIVTEGGLASHIRWEDHLQLAPHIGRFCELRCDLCDLCSKVTGVSPVAQDLFVEWKCQVRCPVEAGSYAACLVLFCK